MNWFSEQRQLWIAEMLRVYGFINREHLMVKFGISQPQASNDLQLFLTTHPKEVEYDLSAKCYVSHSRTTPGARRKSPKKPAK